MWVDLGPQCPIDVNPVEWVGKAIDSRVRWIKSRLRWRREPIRMPKRLYECKTLERLTLSDKILVDVPLQVSLPSLTDLHLLSVVYKDEDSQVRLLSGCPVLKGLKVIRNRDEDDNVRKFSLKVPSLLTLVYREDTIFEEEDDTDRSLVIDTPNLLNLDICDTLGHSCSIEYMPHLVKAVIGVEFYPDENFLRSLSSVKYLFLSPSDAMVPWCDAVTNYSQLAECMLCLIDHDSCESLVVLLSNCLKLKVFKVDTQFEIDESEKHGPVIWNQPSSVPRCLSSHLEIFEWDGYVGREDEKGLTRYIIENSKCLKTAKITPNTSCSVEEIQKMDEEFSSIRTFQRPLLNICLELGRMTNNFVYLPEDDVSKS